MIAGHFFRLSFFFFNDTATTEIYTLSLHDALPIWSRTRRSAPSGGTRPGGPRRIPSAGGCCEAPEDRKSTRLNSSHVRISYAVFCLKKKPHATSLWDRSGWQPVSSYRTLWRVLL